MPADAGITIMRSFQLPFFEGRLSQESRGHIDNSQLFYLSTSYQTSASIGEATTQTKRYDLLKGISNPLYCHPERREGFHRRDAGPLCGPA